MNAAYDRRHQLFTTAVISDRGTSDYRTSRTYICVRTTPAGGDSDRVLRLFGVDPRLSEPIQGQRYDPGEYLRTHGLELGTQEYATPPTAAANAPGR